MESLGASYVDVGIKPDDPREETEDDQDSVNLVISHTIDFPEYYDFLEKNVPVVTPDWISDSIKMGSSVPQRSYSPDPKFFFAKVCATIAGIPQGDTEALLAGLAGFGGQFSVTPKIRTTHIITTNNNHPYCILARERKPDIKIVLPHWVDDCCRFRKLLDETPYLLPNPSILSGKGNGLSPSDINELITIQTNPVYSRELEDGNLALSSTHGDKLVSPSETDSVMLSQNGDGMLTEKARHLFERKQFYLSSDLEVHNRSKSALVALILQAGGTMTDEISNNSFTAESSVYIGKWRESSEYINASRKGWIVGNIDWLLSVIINEEWEFPIKNMLHYPFVRNGLKELHNVSIALTGFTGEARQRYERLIKALGATYSHTLSIGCKYLIASSKRSAKYRAAVGYNINVVNYRWLEDTYSKWACQAVTNQRYLKLTGEINFKPFSQSTKLDLQVLKSFYCSPEEIRTGIVSSSVSTSPSEKTTNGKGKRIRNKLKGKTKGESEVENSTLLNKNNAKVSTLKNVDESESNETTESMDNVGSEKAITAIQKSKEDTRKKSHSVDSTKDNDTLENDLTKAPAINPKIFLESAGSSKPPATPSPSKEAFSNPTSQKSIPPAPETPSTRVRGSARKAQQSAAAKLKASVEDMNEYEKVKNRKLHNLPLPDDLKRSLETNKEKDREAQDSDMTSVDANGDEKNSMETPNKYKAGSTAKKRANADVSTSHETPTKQPSASKSRKRQKAQHEHDGENTDSNGSINDPLNSSTKSSSLTPSILRTKGGRKKSSTPSHVDEISGNHDGSLSSAKSSSVRVLGAPIHILSTSLTLPSPQTLDAFASAGVYMEDRPSKCDYVISAKLARTEKLIKSLAHGVRLIGPKLFEDLESAIEGVNVPDYLYVTNKDTGAKEIVIDPTSERYIMPNDPQSAEQGFTTEAVFLANYERYHPSASSSTSKSSSLSSPLFKDYTFNYKQGTGVYDNYDNLAREHGAKNGVEMKSFRSSKVTMIPANRDNNSYSGAEGIKAIVDYVSKESAKLQSKTKKKRNSVSGNGNSGDSADIEVSQKENIEGEYYKVKILVTKESKSSDSASSSFVKSVMAEGYVPVVVSSQWLIKCIFRSKIEFTSDVLWPKVENVN